MKNNKNQQIIIGGAVIFRENRGRRQFLLVRQKENENWEIPKVTVRRGESSVRAVIRLASEQGGMAVRVLEEAGRFAGSTIVNAKSIPQKFYYYLMLQKGGSSDLIGFDEFKWLDYNDAFKKIGLKREKDILNDAKDVLKEWEKTHNLKKQEVVMF
jgi:8-oxo-dGTP pyrophosphatase MutT (NUDIX family)